MKKIFISILIIFFSFTATINLKAAEEGVKPLSPDWGFKGFLGKFDRGSLQRGYQVYNLSLIHI